jgi:LysM repeat protein
LPILVTLSEIAEDVQNTLAVLFALNPKITNPDYLLSGHFIETPAHLPNILFAYTAHSGDTLGNLADQYGIILKTWRL